ncbi:MAG: hypothetical protein GC206_13300 [Alphaproteobacteria bacterium]|nr:hypothetical protein [Alphaproteobacteria bacterium]
MDLKSIKDASGLTWKEMERRTGVPEGNLHKIAHLKRRFDLPTGLKIKDAFPQFSIDAQAELIEGALTGRPLPATRRGERRRASA